MTPTSRTALLPAPSSSARETDPATLRARTCAEWQESATSGHHVVPRPAWVNGKPAAFPTTAF